jgi:hypothetical protein
MTRAAEMHRKDHSASDLLLALLSLALSLSRSMAFQDLMIESIDLKVLREISIQLFFCLDDWRLFLIVFD